MSCRNIQQQVNALSIKLTKESPVCRYILCEEEKICLHTNKCMLIFFTFKIVAFGLEFQK